MKSLMLWKTVARDCATRCRTDAQRDVHTVTSRLKTEGFSFLTITLPGFGQDFERSLELGLVDNTRFLSFKKTRGLPAFLSGFLCQIFDRSTGVLLDDPSTDAIFSIRQLCLMFKKMHLPCSPKREAMAIREYVKCDEEVKGFCYDLDSFHRIANLLFGELFSDIDFDVYNQNLIPLHGPGATSESIYGNGKWTHLTWPTRLEEHFPFLENALPNHRYHDELSRVDFLEPEAEVPIRVVSVPKTMKTPRIIGIEPVAMQYAQQALFRCIRERLPNHKVSSFIGLDDQKPNQLLARQGSIFGDLATLDLSEASDRVSIEHVRALASRFPSFLGLLEASRSVRALLPSGDIHTIAKFASMGSAVTFPIEAFVFLTIIFEGYEDSLGRQLTPKDIKSLRGRVRVYGDDIIVPVTIVRHVIDRLTSHGMKVNHRKSFWNGQFRESCGADYYGGVCVKPTYFRRNFPRSREDVQEIISLVSFRNQAFEACLDETVAFLDKEILKIIKIFPYVGRTSPVLGRWTWDSTLIKSCSKNRYQTPMIKGYLVRSVIPVNQVDGVDALRKCLTILEVRKIEVAAQQPDHLRRSGRPQSVGIKIGVGTAG